jgi:hypothetical protein
MNYSAQNTDELSFYGKYLMADVDSGRRNGADNGYPPHMHLLSAVLGMGLVALLLAATQTDLGSQQDALVAATVLVAPLRRPRGRPRKFDEPSRVVSLTLPESVIASLTDMHGDLAHAVTRLARKVGERARRRKPAELVMFGRRATISVRPSRTLARRLEVELVPMPDGRALIAFDAPQTLAEFELRLHDALDDAAISGEDREACEAMRAILRDARRSEDMALAVRNIIVLESVPGAKRKAGATG